MNGCDATPQESIYQTGLYSAYTLNKYIENIENLIYFDVLQTQHTHTPHTPTGAGLDGRRGGYAHVETVCSVMTWDEAIRYSCPVVVAAYDIKTLKYIATQRYPHVRCRTFLTKTLPHQLCDGYRDVSHGRYTA